MKNIFLIIVLCIYKCFAGISFSDVNISGHELQNTSIKTYYIKNGGDDEADGRTFNTAWASLSKVSDVIPERSTIVYLDANSTWRENITLKSGGGSAQIITYTSYGIGQASIYGSVNKSETSNWNDLGSNIWSCTGLTCDVGSIIFNNDSSCGIKLKLEVDLDAQGEFWYDYDNDLIKFYSVGNPASVYSNIELCLKCYAVTGANYTVFNDINIKYSGSHGYFAPSGTHDIEVSDCTISYCGGADKNDDYDIRYGNGIELWGEIKNALIENNTVSECYDTGITVQSNENYSEIDNVIFQDNTITNCEMSCEYWNSGYLSVNSDITFQRNTCSGAGSGIMHDSRWALNGRTSLGTHFAVFELGGSQSNVNFINNTLGDAVEQGIWILHDEYYSEFTSDNNSFDVDSDCAYVEDIDITYASLLDWQIASSQDGGSNEL